MVRVPKMKNTGPKTTVRMEAKNSKLAILKTRIFDFFTGISALSTKLRKLKSWTFIDNLLKK